ncbi:MULTISPECIES: hypothetical protein [unclassified Mycobacterium]|uniref:hypothetical protein n=1 Tax=unclassified Mycobacterium TaxID=2642494 RepID=UPI0027412129|nr:MULTISPECIES: hypothetical protein [unclassified Mycobacterium]MDP7703556.1 hypothetical protein [Mycobacterium sp. TY815]MDP7722038.1 hypothetical protein [Mycobacterium sp. TY814]
MPAQNSALRTGRGNGGAIGLVALHAVLVLFTVLLNLALLVTADPHDQCRIHHVHCERGSHLREAALISAVGTGVLIIVEVVATTYAYLWRRRRLPLVIPLLCSIGQSLILVTAFTLGSAGL